MNKLKLKLIKFENDEINCGFLCGNIFDCVTNEWENFESFLRGNTVKKPLKLP